jgi:hypothetical protein
MKNESSDADVDRPRVPGTPDLCVVVLGVFRSGTSVVAGMLDHLGVRMGPRNPRPNWMEVSPWSPTGTYENADFRWFDWLALGVDPRSPQSSLPDDWRERMSRVKSEDVISLVRAAEGGAWGWKDPYTVLTLPLFLPHLKNPRLVVVRRNPADVARSIHRQDWASMDEATRLVRILMDETDVDLDRFKDLPRLEFTFDEVTHQAGQVVEKLVTFLGLDPPQSARAAATSLVRSKAAQSQDTRRLAVSELVKTPRWFGYSLILEVRLGSRSPRTFLGTTWRKLVQTLRLATSG